MASLAALRKIVQSSPTIQRGAEFARQEIFGHLPQLNIQSGHQKAKKSFTGPYLARYYPESINTYARKVCEIHENSNVMASRGKMSDTYDVMLAFLYFSLGP